MSGMFESRKTNSEVEKEKIEEKKVIDIQEEHYTLEQASKMLGISITLLRNKLPEYKVETGKSGKSFIISKESFYSIKRQRIIAGVRKLSCIKDFELCEDCIERMLKEH